jgi:xanthine dehydrogenase accessory factor
MIPLLEEALRQHASQHRCAFVTVVSVAGSGPQVAGAKMLVVDAGDRHLTYGTIGGGNLEHTALQEALDSLGAGTPRLVEKDLGRDLGMACGGRVSYFIEPVTLPPRLVICGGGHVGLALHRVVRDLGFSVTVVDSLPEFANTERFPGARIVGSFDEVVLERELPPGPDTYVVLVSRDHPTDFRLARFFVRRPFKYLGVIASRTKAAILRRELESEGCDPAAVARLVAPIGLPIGGASPAEIAIGVAAQIIQVRNGAGNLDSGVGPFYRGS